MISKYIKKGLKALIALPLMGALMQSCESDDPFFAVSEDDSPRFLNTDLQSVSEDGSMLSFTGISTAENFNYEAIVTPVDYTTIEWFFDGVSMCTSKTIDMPFLAGTYTVKVVATTTKGNTTYRERKLTVTPLATDPTLSDAAKARWFTIGQTQSITGTYLDGITKLYIGGVNGVGATEATNFSNEGDKLTFTVPTVQEGDLNITLENAEGKNFGCGKAHVSKDEYVPISESVCLFEGDMNVPEWTCDDVCSTVMQQLVATERVVAGASLTIQFEKTATDYAKIALIGNDWRGILTGQSDPNRGEIDLEDGQTSVTVEIPQVGIDIIKTNGFYITGHGYKIKKVTVEAQPFNGVVFSGNLVAPDWGEHISSLSESVTKLVNDGSIQVGSKIVVLGEYTATDYCSLALVDKDWTSVIDGSTGNDRTILHFTADSNSDSFVVTQTTIEIIKAGGFYINGHGFTITKITVE